MEEIEDEDEREVGEEKVDEGEWLKECNERGEVNM